MNHPLTCFPNFFIFSLRSDDGYQVLQASVQCFHTEILRLTHRTLTEGIYHGCKFIFFYLM